MVMPVIPKPADAPPLFGDRAMILFGGYDKEAMRQWQERVRASKKDPAETSIESVRFTGDDAHGPGGNPPAQTGPDSATD